jgi:hypothetical protein
MHLERGGENGFWFLENKGVSASPGGEPDWRVSESDRVREGREVTRTGNLTGRWLYDDLARKERNWVLTWAHGWLNL